MPTPLTLSALPAAGDALVIWHASLGGAAVADEQDERGIRGQYVSFTDVRNGYAVVRGYASEEYFLPLDGSVTWSPRP
jgi:hypothetical protein